MADKKVERSFRERPLTSTQKLTASLSDQGTVNMAEPTHDKGKSALVGRFREREDRWRREQALRAQQAAGETREEQQGTPEAGESVGSNGQEEGGES
jgi:hypothetical protein